MRERNESLILKDSLDHLGKTVDAIIVFDDCSTDDSIEIARAHPKVIEVIENKKWKNSNRAWEETANRHMLLAAAKEYNPEWLFYCDADERFEGNIRNYLLHECPTDVNGIKISLFDAYITKNDMKPIRRGDKLFDFRQYFGREKRDILMIWRNMTGVDFLVSDARPPQNVQPEIITKFYCQHYGKSLSVEHWDETCRYYMNYFPKYSEKWRERLGKAIHNETDFGTELMLWKEVKKDPIS